MAVRALALILALVFVAPAQQPDESFQTLRNHALLRAHSYAWLEELTDTIGPRLTGSPAAEAAARWAARKMESIGMQNVHLEHWEMPKGWQRRSASAELTAPIQVPLSVASYGWTGSTSAPGVEAELVLVNRDAPASELPRSASWMGKIVFLASRGPKPAGGLSDVGSIVAAAQSAHAAAVIARDPRPGIMLTHTGPVTFGRDIAYSIPVVDIAEEHQQLIERLLASGKQVRMRIAVENRFSAGPVESANVVGDMPGREHPEQVVILGAHMDSWDLATGAVDDGYGVATVLGAVESIAASGRKPRRTIRVVFFSGEEQGLLGSQAWVRAHAAEIPNLVCALVVDWGQGPIRGLPLAGHDELDAPFRNLSEIVGAVQPLKITNGYLTFTDAYSFTLAGVPGLAFAQEFGNYGSVGHSAADTLDKVDAVVQARNTAVVALTAFWVADHPNRLGAAWPAAKTAQTLIEGGQLPVLQMFGLWPFPVRK